MKSYYCLTSNISNSKKDATKVDVIRLVSIFLMALLILSCFFVLSACKKKPDDYVIDDGFVTVSMPAPTDGSLPTDHTALENVAYLNSTFAKQTNYYAETRGTTLSVGIEQMVNAHKQFDNGVLIVADITSSSLIKKARQFCYTGDEVMWRSSANKKFDGLNTVWKDELEGHVSVADFKANYGLPATEFSAYVINQDTLLDATPVTANADGTYSVTLNLSTAEQTGAGAYYAKQMVFAGGLDDYPEFLYINVTYTFDKDWRILATDVQEAYKAKMGISVECESTFRTVYEYNTQKATATAYDSFFKKHTGSVGVFVPVEKQPEAVGCLGEAFGSILTGPTTLDVALQVNGKPLVGSVYLDLSALTKGGSLDDLVAYADFGAISLWLEKGRAFLAYNGLKLQFSVEELLSFVQTFTGDNSVDVGGLDMDGLLASLGEGEFDYVSKQSASLTSVLPLLGLEIPVEFAFILDAKNNASLKDVNATINLDGTTVKAKLSFGNQVVEGLTETQKATFAQVLPYVNSVLEIAQAQALNLGVDVTLGDVNLQGNVNLALENLQLSATGVNVGGQLVVTYKQTSKQVNFALQNGVVYLEVDGLKVKANLQDAIAFVTDLLNLQPSSLDIAQQSGVDVNSLIAVLLEGKIAEGIQITESDNQLNVALYTSKILQTLGLSLDGFDIGEIAVAVNSQNKNLQLTAQKINVGGLGELGVQLTAQKGQLPEQVNASQYVDLLEIAEPIKNIFASEKIGGRVEYSAQDFVVCGEFVVARPLQVQAKVSVTYHQITKQALLQFVDGVIYAQIDGLKLRISIDEVTDLVDILAKDMPSLTIDQTKLIQQILSVDFSQFVALSQKVEDGATITSVALQGTELLKLLGIDFALGQVDVTVANDLLSATVLDANVELYATTQTLESLTEQQKQSYLQLSPIIYKVLSVVENKALSLTGKITLGIDETPIYLDVSQANVSWTNGLNVEVCGLLKVENVSLNIKLLATESCVKVALGNLGVQLAYDEFATLEEAFVAVYNNIYDLVGQMSATETNPLPQIKGLDDLIALLKGSKAIAQTGNAIVDSSNGSLIDTILSQVELSNFENGIAVKLGDIQATLTSLEEGLFALSVDGQLQNIAISAQVNTNLLGESVEMPQITYLTATDFVEIFDYATALVNTLVQQDISLQAKIVTNSADTNAYADGIKQQIDIKVDLHSGDEVPLHFNLDTKSLYLSTNLYLHLTLSVKNFENVEGNDIYLDLWLYNESGKEFLQAVAQVSKFEPTHAKYQPLVLTASADQLMSVLSSALALFGLDDGILHDWVVSKWISAETSSQLYAIGSSLFEVINLEELLSGVVGTATQQQTDICLDEIIQLVLNKDESGNYNGVFNVVVDGDVLFGAGASNLNVTLQKVSTEKGSLFQAVSVDNVTLANGNESMFVEASLDYAPIDVATPTIATNAVCYQADGLKELFESLAKSITHKATAEDVANGLADALGQNVINPNFYISGTASLKLNLASLFNISVNIDIVALSIDVDKDGNVTINICLQYKAKKVALTTAINGDTILDITIKGDMMYMRRTQTSNANGDAITPIVICRALPLANLAGTNAQLMDHIGFMFNLSSTVTGILDKTITEETTKQEELLDFGAQAYNLIKSYQSTNNGNVSSWSVALNGSALTNQVLGDINFAISTNNDGILNSIHADTSIKETGVDVEISADLVYRNPQNLMQEGIVNVTKDVSSLLENAMSKKIVQMQQASWLDANGKPTYAEGRLYTINYYLDGKHIDSQTVAVDMTTSVVMADIVCSTISQHLEGGYTLTGWQINGIDYPLGENVVASGNIDAYALYEENLYDVLFTSNYQLDESWIFESQTGLYVKTTQMYYKSQIVFVDNNYNRVTFQVGYLPSQNVFALPQLPDGIVWEEFVTNQNGFVVNAKDDSDFVILSSTVAFNYDDGINSAVNTTREKYKFKFTYNLAKPTATGYTFIGWFKQENGNYVKVDNIAFSNGQKQETTLYALWATNLSVKFDSQSRSLDWGKYTYKASITTTGGQLVGIDDINATATISYRFWASKSAGYTAGTTVSSSANYNVTNGYTANVTATSGLTEIYNNVNVVVKLSYVIGGQTFYVDDGNATNTGSEIGAYLSASVKK